MVPSQMLVASYLIHMIATVVWIGGIVFMALVVMPAAQREPSGAGLVAAIQRRFVPIANMSLIVLIVTGMVQLTSSTHYAGFLNFSNLWAKAILIKHIAVAGMVGTGLYMTLVLQPDISRLTLLQSAGKATPAQAADLARRQSWLSQVDILLALAVLLFTAIARAQ